MSYVLVANGNVIDFNLSFGDVEVYLVELAKSKDEYDIKLYNSVDEDIVNKLLDKAEEAASGNYIQLEGKRWQVAV